MGAILWQVVQYFCSRSVKYHSNQRSEENINATISEIYSFCGTIPNKSKETSLTVKSCDGEMLLGIVCYIALCSNTRVEEIMALK